MPLHGMLMRASSKDVSKTEQSEMYMIIVQLCVTTYLLSFDCNQVSMRCFNSTSGATSFMVI